MTACPIGQPDDATRSSAPHALRTDRLAAMSELGTGTIIAPTEPHLFWMRWHRLFVIGGAVLVVLISLWQSNADLRVSRFHPDESRWINRAPHLSELGHPLSAYWADAYLIRGQPPMGSYITGLGLVVQGYDLKSNGPWNFSFGNEADINWNVTYGNMPSASYLLAARHTSIAIGALTCLAVYLIVTMLSNWVGGTVAGVFMAVHPLSVYLFTLAVSDAAFTFVVALSVLTAAWLARKPTWGRAILLGIVLGIGASLKLSPIFVSLGLAVIGMMIVPAPAAIKVRPVRWFWNRMGACSWPVQRLGWMLIALPLITGFFFVASYPYLWPDPVGRTKVLFDFRRDEMANQSRIWGDAAITSRPEALYRTWDMLEDRYSASGKFLVKFGIVEPRVDNPDGEEPGYDLPFAIAGLVIFAATAIWRGFRSPQFLAFLTLMGQSVIIVLGLNVDFDRYYLPLVLMFAIGLGVGVGEVTGLIACRWARRERSCEVSAAVRGKTAAVR